MTTHADVGLIGLAVMGQNLVLNMADQGFTVAVYNRTTSTMEAFVGGRGKRDEVIGARSLEALVGLLERPRRIVLMVQAGRAVDAVIEELVPLLDQGDVIVDAGNSFFEDTVRREAALRERGLRYLGTGVSGGEEGARFGPSIMPGGEYGAWQRLQEVFEAIAAKVDGEPCVAWMGESGSGHYVKMIHNGIEYGDMQLIAEAYQLLREGLGLEPPELKGVFERWNQGVLDSYLIEISRDILGTYDEDGNLVLDLILDRAGQKGTGRWTAIGALEAGQPVTLITEAVFARMLSALKDERERAASVLEGPERRLEAAAAAGAGAAGADGKQAFIEDLEQALYASKIVSYAQGYMLLRDTARERGWSIDMGATARIWRGGCIIRSRFLNDITAAFEADPELENLMLAPFFRHALAQADAAWRRVVAEAVRAGVPVPAMSAALAFFDGYRSRQLPANLLQAQRDYFGAHTYERVDRPRGEYFHTDWIGSGGGVTSRAYEYEG
jgi:6-phosphogluconate dehydrogenase